MINNLKQNHEQHYMRLFRDDMQFMVSDAYHWGNVETGGALYGLWTHAGRPVIMLATPAGPDACNQTAHFAQNPDHVFEMSQKLQGKFGIQYLGNWHSHHSLGMDHPSGGDVEQIHRVATKSNVSRMIQIVITCTQKRVPFFRTPAICQKITTSLINTMKVSPLVNEVLRPCNDSCETMEKMCVNAFIYTDAKKGSYQRCPVTLLSETNPIRIALAGSELIHAGDMQPKEDFPLEGIIYDKVDASHESQASQEVIPAFIIRQISSLPDRVAEKVEVHVNHGMLFLSVPMGDKTIVVAYRDNPTECRICSVGVVGDVDKQMTDMTDKVLKQGQFLPLSRIYERIENLMQTNAPQYIPNQSAKPEFRCKGDKVVNAEHPLRTAELENYTENTRRTPPCGHEHNRPA